MSEPISAADIGVQLFTISDTRKHENDRTGSLMAKKIQKSNFRLVGQDILREDRGEIRQAVESQFNRAEVRAIITAGGTGLSDRDRTLEELRPLLDSELEGFGELFRQLSYEQVGARCLLSRATAGRSGNDALFMLPGSPDAAELALDELILPVLHHLMEVIEQ